MARRHTITVEELKDFVPSVLIASDGETKRLFLETVFTDGEPRNQFVLKVKGTEPSIWSTLERAIEEYNDL